MPAIKSKKKNINGGGGLNNKKSYKKCKRFKIKGSDQNNMNKCICIDTDDSLLYNTHIFKCDTKTGLRLKTNKEIESDEADDDDEEQKYYKEIVEYLNTQLTAEKLKQKTNVDSALTTIFKKYNIEDDVTEGIDAIYDFLLMSHSSKSSANNNTPSNSLKSSNNSALSPSQMRKQNISTEMNNLSIDDIEGVDTFTKSRIEQQRLAKKKVFTRKLKKKTNTFFRNNSTKISNKLVGGIKSLRSKTVKSMKVLFNNTDLIIKDIKKIKDQVQIDWYNLLVNEIKNTKRSKKFIYRDLFVFLELSERYDKNQLSIIEDYIKKYFNNLTQDQQSKKLEEFLRESTRFIFLKDMEDKSGVNPDQIIEDALRGVLSKDEELIEEIKKITTLDTISKLYYTPDFVQVETLSKSILLDKFLKFEKWNTSDRSISRAERAYVMQVERWIQEQQKESLLGYISEIIEAVNNPLSKASTKIEDIINQRISLYSSSIKLQTLGLDAQSVVPKGWKFSKSTGKYICISSKNNLSTVRIPRKGMPEYDECETDTRLAASQLPSSTQIQTPDTPDTVETPSSVGSTNSNSNSNSNSI